MFEIKHRCNKGLIISRLKKFTQYVTQQLNLFFHFLILINIYNNLVFFLPILLSLSMYVFNIDGNESDFYTLNTSYNFKINRVLTLLLYTFVTFFFLILCSFFIYITCIYIVCNNRVRIYYDQTFFRLQNFIKLFILQK